MRKKYCGSKATVAFIPTIAFRAGETRLWAFAGPDNTRQLNLATGDNRCVRLRYQ